MTRTSLYVSVPEAGIPLGDPDTSVPPGVEQPSHLEVLKRLFEAGEYEVDPEFVALRIIERAGI